MTPLHIVLSPLREEHHPDILRIAQSQLGEGYLDAASLTEKKGLHAVVALSGNTVVGFCLGHTVPLKEFLDSNPRLHTLDLSGLSELLTAGLVSTVAVSSEHTGFGVGRKLVGACIELLKASGAQALMMTAWKSEKGVHIGGIATHFGFTNLGELENFWRDDSLASGYTCSACGAPPCRCSALFFIKQQLRPL